MCQRKYTIEKTGITSAKKIYTVFFTRITNKNKKNGKWSNGGIPPGFRSIGGIGKHAHGTRPRIPQTAYNIIQSDALERHPKTPEAHAEHAHVFVARALCIGANGAVMQEGAN